MHNKVVIKHGYVQMDNDRPAFLIVSEPPPVYEVPPPEEKDTNVDLFVGENIEDTLLEQEKQLWEMKRIIADQKIMAQSIIDDAQSTKVRILAETNDLQKKILAETEEQKTELFEQVKQDAFEQGKYEGYQKGFEDSFQKGKDTGLEEGKQEGYNIGYSEGMEQGRIIGEREVKDEMAELVLQAGKEAEQIIEDGHKKARAIVEASDEEIAKIAFAVCEKILNREIVTTPDIVINIINEAIGKVAKQSALKIKIAPENYKLVVESLPQIKLFVEGNQNIDVDVDETLRKADVIIETSNGIVDARLETQTLIMREAIEELIRNA